MNTFARQLTSLMPDGITLPAPLIEAFDWLEDQGWLQIREGGTAEDHCLAIYPEPEVQHLGASMVTFGGATLPHTGHWSTPDPKVDARIAQIATTSGDGGRAAIWLDDAGHQHFVQIGHDAIGAITDDPLVFLQYLAMGYSEPGSLEATDITPQQSTLDYHGIADISELADDERPIAPTIFQAFLKERFDLDMPQTARALGIADFCAYDDPDTADPFARWLTSVTPPPTAEELAYMQELMQAVEGLDFKEDDSSDTIMEKIGSLFKSKDTDK